MNQTADLTRTADRDRREARIGAYDAAVSATGRNRGYEYEAAHRAIVDAATALVQRREAALVGSMAAAAGLNDARFALLFDGTSALWASDEIIPLIQRGILLDAARKYVAENLPVAA